MNVTIYNMPCQEAVLLLDNESIDCVITSPPYGGKVHNGFHGNNLYDKHADEIDVEAYNRMCVDLFNGLSAKLKRTGVVCWNVSYNKGNSEGYLRALMAVLDNTPFKIADVMAWRKPMAVTIDSPNRLTRICEQVYILVRRDGYEDYYCNKVVSSVCNGRNKYGAVFNYIETKKNNDEKQELNGATFPTEFAYKLLDIYCPKNGVAFDPFMGTGTTANAARNYGCAACYGAEISKAQCEYAKKRLDDFFSSCEIIS